MKEKIRDRFLKKEWSLLLILFVVAFLSRYLLIKDGFVPFQFDHGKDSLAILDMWLNKSPKLVGPWTSIAGLYFGPAWYYLLLPGFLIGGWHPLSPVFVMIFLLLLQIYLAYRYLGKEEAILITTAPLWIMTSTSAWNPFPMTLISLIILILLKKMKEQKRAKKEELFLIFFSASLGFHFSTAFAILYPLLIILSLYKYKIKLTWKKLLTMIIAYLIPFIPQIIFELRHNFVETRAVISYLQNGEGQSFSFLKIQAVFNTIFDYFKFSVLPTAHYPSHNYFDQLAFLFFIFLILRALFLKKRKKNNFKLTLALEYLLWPILALAAYSFLHFNIWYVLGLTPLFVMFAGDILRAQNKFLNFIFISLMFISLFLKVHYFLTSDRYNLQQASSFLAPKIQAIDLIRQDANGRIFNSYHYAPDIYDFSYQYLYFWQALKGEVLPAEFSYQKEEINYVVQKTDLLNFFEENSSASEAEINYFIVEPAEVEEYQLNWWGNFKINNQEALDKIPTNSLLKIYKQERI